jgi:hypothetical protein
VTGVWDVVALALGVLVVGVLAYFMSPRAAQGDPDMMWEGRVATGFAALLPGGVLWIGQVAATLLATVTDGGVRPAWLWGWLVAAPLLGASPPATALARRLQRMPRNGSAGADPHRRVAAVQQAANLAWADTGAEPGWELRRTPPLPICWPPPPNGSAVWFCYAERPSAAGSVELAGPWARITLPADGAAAPIAERWSDSVEPIGRQQAPGNAVGASQAELVDAARRGDPNGVLAPALGEWRAHNALIAAHPRVAPHLPPA